MSAGDRQIDAVVPLEVIIVTAGISGITAGIFLTHKVPGIELHILERNADIGGVWHANVYPGIRCDVPSDVYQSSFAPSTTWTENYAQGPEIKEYWRTLAAKYNLEARIHFNTTVTRAVWSETTAFWSVHLQSCEKGESIQEASFLILATGLFSTPRLPDIPGVNTFSGHLRHSADWDPTFDPTGRRIAVIGNGASGLQIVTALQKMAACLHHYFRSGAWIVPSYGGETLDRTTRTPVPTEPAAYLQYRKSLEDGFFKSFGTILKHGERNEKVASRVRHYMTDKLADRPDLLAKLMPDFPIGCRQSTPAPDYLEAIQQCHVECLSTPIDCLTESGIKLVDGTHHEYDAILCCTGSDTTYPPFPILCGTVNLQDVWSTCARTYLGMAAPDFPNLFFLLGPQSAGLAGTVPNTVENQATYLAKILRKVSAHGIRSIVPTRAATDAFQEYCDVFWQRTVLMDGCKSWYNAAMPGGRVTGLWPGSATHANRARRDVRFEDFAYTYHSSPFSWLGSGQTMRDLAANGRDDDSVDYSPHLQPSDAIDLQSIHESWYDV